MSFSSARKKAGFSQAEVARQVDVSEAAVSMWGIGKNKPRADMLVKLSKLFGCTVDELLKEGNGPNESVPNSEKEDDIHGRGN